MKRYLKTLYLSLALALVLNAILPAFFSYRQKDNSNDLSSILGEKIIICTAYGFKTIDANDPDNDDNNKNGNKAFCPLCILSSLHTEFTPNSDPAENLFFTYSKYYKISSQNFAIYTDAFINSKSSRAPPLFS